MLTKEQVIEAASTGKSLRGVNLWGVNLSWLTLKGIDLRNADLYDANLSCTNLEGANLSGTYLGKANLAGAYFHEADLSHANLLAADLIGAFFQRANLTGARFYPASILLANWPFCTQETITQLMRLDASCHPHPESFDEWKQNGKCPYDGMSIQRVVPSFYEDRRFWSPGPPPTLWEVIEMLFRDHSIKWEYSSS